ncbi:MAG: hypothetical protein JRE23_17245 [Deltaproteobacteria bacterium]|nr:hypothetical protein [Deltaproteobacteria bacterium]
MSRPGHIAVIAGVLIILSVILFFSLSACIGDGVSRDARLEEVRCTDCHEQERFLPSYHKPAGKWTKRHGHKVKTLVRPAQRVKTPLKPGHVYDCGLCHSDDACRKCHQVNRPKDHTGFWRTRGHGIKGVAQRESCAYCHDEIFCIRCLKNTKPINHRGNWNSVHGNAITTAGDAQRCSVCHPRVIAWIHVGNVAKCRLCHPQ